MLPFFLQKFNKGEKLHMLYLATHVKNLNKAIKLKEELLKHKIIGEPELYLKKQLYKHKGLKSTWIVAAVLERSSDGVQNNV